jgi:hypothetical protein
MADGDELAKYEANPKATEDDLAKFEAKPKGAGQRFTESFRQGLGFAPEGGPKEDISQIGQGFKQMVTHPIESGKLLVGEGIIKPMQETAESGIARMKQPGFGNKLAGATEYLESGIPVIGPWLAGAGHQFENRDIAGGLGTMAPALIPEAAGKTLEAAPKVIPSRTAIGKAAAKVLRNPKTGEITITPGSVLERITPERPEQAAGRFESEHGAKIEAAEKARQKEITDQARMRKSEEGEHKKFADRMTEEEGIRQKELAANERLKEQHAQSLIRRGTEEERLAEENAPKIATPETRPTARTGNEGRAATWDNETVIREANAGNREGISQVVRRGLDRDPRVNPNIRYVAGDPDLFRATYNPKEVTRFTPEGTPIRDLSKPQRSTGATIEIPQGYAETPSEALGAIGTPIEASSPRQAPFVAPEAPVLRQSVQELTGKGRAHQTPEWMEGQQAYDIAEMWEVVRNPNATAEEKAIATQRLKDYGVKVE